MGAQRTVALSLDIESHLIWEQLPKGERSRRVREALSVAHLVLKRDEEIEYLRGFKSRALGEIKKLKLSNLELRDFGCKCVVGNVSVGDLE
tara:strand:+ start:761 stop:1033 length:273 start_codon:yes stop_codon:yes gene_type:complete